jgi:glutamine amidotransferase-like uncharacterized protein
MVIVSAKTCRLCPLCWLCLAALFLSRLEAQTPPDGNALRIGVYVDEGAGPSVKNLLSVLSKFDDVSVTQLRANDIRSGKLAELDLLMQPGGSGGGQGRHLGEDGRDAIRGFVKAGGGFVGICAGSYLTIHGR